MPEDMDDQKTKNPLIIPGVSLIVVGIIMLAANYLPGLSIPKLWPFFMLIPAFIFVSIMVQHGKKAEGLLVPLVIDFGYMVYFLWLNFTTWENVYKTWPVFILVAGFSFLVLFISTKRAPTLVPAIFLGSLGVLFIGLLHGSNLIISLSFIVVGAFILLRPLAKKKENKDNDKKPPENQENENHG